MFTDICRGLFESHKKIYSFLICTSIRRENKSVGPGEWNYLIRGTAKVAKQINPDNAFITQNSWDFICAAEETCGELKGIADNIKTNINDWKNFVKTPNMVTSPLP